MAGSVFAFVCSEVCSFSTVLLGVGRLNVNHLAFCRFPHWIRSGLLSSTGITRFHRYYEPLRHLRPPPTSLTGLPLVPSAALPHGRRLLLLRTVHIPCVLPSLPRWNRGLRFSFTLSAASAFVVIVATRLPHWLFRGLLDVHSRYGPHGPLILQRGPFPEVLQTIRFLLIRFRCFRLEREFAGPDFHREEPYTFSRHTQ
jgi:hypothetical protein